MKIQSLKKVKIFSTLLLVLLLLSSCGGSGGTNSNPSNQNSIEDNNGTIEGSISSIINILLPVAYADNSESLCSSSCNLSTCAELHIYNPILQNYSLECRTNAVLNSNNGYDYKFIVNKKLLSSKTYKVAFLKNGSLREAISFHNGNIKEELNLNIESTFSAPLVEKAMEENKDKSPNEVLNKIKNEVNLELIKKTLKENKLIPDNSNDDDLNEVLKVAPEEFSSLFKDQYSEVKSCVDPSISNSESPKCSIKGDDYKKLKDVLGREFSERIDSDDDSIADAFDCEPENNKASVLKILYSDKDGDGFGIGEGSELCAPLKDKLFNFADNNQDCNDDDESLNINCENNVIIVDSDNDGISDSEDCSPNDNKSFIMKELYVDNDQDGFGCNEILIVCSGNDKLPQGYSDNNLDCNDNDKDKQNICAEVPSITSSSSSSEVSSEQSSEVSSEQSSEVSSEQSSEASSEQSSEASSEQSSEVSSEQSSEASSEQSSISSSGHENEDDDKDVKDDDEKKKDLDKKDSSKREEEKREKEKKESEKKDAEKHDEDEKESSDKD